MLRLSLVALGLGATFSTASQASVMTIGGGNAQSCFLAAEAQRTDAIALEYCDTALAEDGLIARDRVASLVNRGVLYMRRADLGRATADFDSALKLDPHQPDAWLNKAILEVRYRNGADALPLVERALKDGTRMKALAYFVRGVAHEDSGNIAAAYRDLKLAQSLDPKWSEPSLELRRYQVRR